MAGGESCTGGHCGARGVRPPWRERRSGTARGWSSPSSLASIQQHSRPIFILQQCAQHIVVCRRTRHLSLIQQGQLLFRPPYVRQSGPQHFRFAVRTSCVHVPSPLAPIQCSSHSAVLGTRGCPCVCVDACCGCECVYGRGLVSLPWWYFRVQRPLTPPPPDNHTHTAQRRRTRTGWWWLRSATSPPARS